MDTQPSHQLRARFCGTLDWLCPWCGYLNRSRIDRTGWFVQCKAKRCRRRFAHGMIFHSLERLQGSGRRYAQPADVTFPVARMDYWAPGAPVHRVVLDEGPEDEDAITEPGGVAP